MVMIPPIPQAFSATDAIRDLFTRSLLYVLPPYFMPCTEKLPCLSAMLANFLLHTHITYLVLPIDIVEGKMAQDPEYQTHHAPPLL